MARNIEEFGLSRVELIAALMEDSIGYLTPQRAERHIQKWEAGEDTCFCERCNFIFQRDLRLCLQCAAEKWEYLSEERRQRLLDVVRQISELDATAQTTIGLLWPTMDV